MSACSSCGAPIRWAVSDKTGKRMPLDREPVVTGNVRVIDERAYVLNQHERNVANDQGVALYVNHFATCPNARKHRR